MVVSYLGILKKYCFLLLKKTRSNNAYQAKHSRPNKNNHQSHPLLILIKQKQLTNTHKPIPLEISI